MTARMTFLELLQIATVPGAQWMGDNAAGIFDYTPSTENYYVPDGMYYWTLRGQKRGDVWYDMSGTITLIR